MFKIIFRILVIIFLTGSAVAIFFFPDAVREYYPNFSLIKFSTVIVFFCGCFYAILERNIFIGITTLLLTMAIPWVVRWFRMYWFWTY